MALTAILTVAWAADGDDYDFGSAVLFGSILFVPPGTGTGTGTGIGALTRSDRRP